MHLTLRHKLVNLKLYIALTISSSNHLSCMAGGSSSLFFYDRCAVHQTVEHTTDCGAVVLCCPASLFKTINGYVLLMRDKVKLLINSYV